MSGPEFSLVVQRRPDGVVVKLRGDADASAVSELDSALRRVVAEGAQVIEIDVRLTELGAVTALKPIVWAFKEVRSQGGDLVLRDPSATTLQLLEAAGLRKTIPIVQS